MRNEARKGPKVQAELHAAIDKSVSVGNSTRVWGLAQVREGASLGQGCIVGRGAYIDAGVQVGDRCKIQNNALVYAPATLEDGVFVGPAAVLTNDRYPRAVNPDGSLKSGQDWEPAGVLVREGAALGAHSTVIGGVTVGRWAVVAAGAVVTRDVPDFALVAGVPARRVAWVGRSGRPLQPDGDGAWRCPVDGSRYRETGAGLVDG